MTTRYYTNANGDRGRVERQGRDEIVYIEGTAVTRAIAPDSYMHARGFVPVPKLSPNGNPATARAENKALYADYLRRTHEGPLLSRNH